MGATPEAKKPRTFKERLVHTGKRIALEKERYILIAPGLVWYAIFAYIPIFGLSLACRK